jgi:antitoxin PrlF
VPKLPLPQVQIVYWPLDPSLDPAALPVATLTAKGQVTVPKAVRDALGPRQGDQLSWELEDGSVRVRAVAPLDLAYLKGLEANLREWSSAADEEAFRNL